MMLKCKLCPCKRCGVLSSSQSFSSCYSLTISVCINVENENVPRVIWRRVNLEMRDGSGANVRYGK